MKKIDVIKKLKSISRRNNNIKENHEEADEALLDFIADKDIRKAYEDIYKWYA